MTPAEEKLVAAAFALDGFGMTHDHEKRQAFFQARFAVAAERTTPEMKELIRTSCLNYYRACKAQTEAKQKLMAGGAYDEAMWNRIDGEARKEVYGT